MAQPLTDRSKHVLLVYLSPLHTDITCPDFFCTTYVLSAGRTVQDGQLRMMAERGICHKLESLPRLATDCRMNADLLQDYPERYDVIGDAPATVMTPQECVAQLLRSDRKTDTEYLLQMTDANVRFAIQLCSYLVEALTNETAKNLCSTEQNSPSKKDKKQNEVLRKELNASKALLQQERLQRDKQKEQLDERISTLEADVKAKATALQESWSKTLEALDEQKKETERTVVVTQINEKQKQQIENLKDLNAQQEHDLDQNKQELALLHNELKEQKARAEALAAEAEKARTETRAAEAEKARAEALAAEAEKARTEARDLAQEIVHETVEETADKPVLVVKSAVKEEGDVYAAVRNATPTCDTSSDGSDATLSDYNQMSCLLETAYTALIKALGETKRLQEVTRQDTNKLDEATKALVVAESNSQHYRRNSDEMYRLNQALKHELAEMKRVQSDDKPASVDASTTPSPTPPSAAPSPSLVQTVTPQPVVQPASEAGAQQFASSQTFPAMPDARRKWYLLLRMSRTSLNCSSSSTRMLVTTRCSSRSLYSTTRCRIIDSLLTRKAVGTHVVSALHIDAKRFG